MDYVLIDSGNGQKLERFGSVQLIRPCAQAIWTPRLSEDEWRKADSQFSREKEYHWNDSQRIPNEWLISVAGIRFKLSRTDFGHLGIFPEQASLWKWIQNRVAAATSPPSVLNLFAYSGGSTLAAALQGARVCHLDAAKGMVDWARENALLNHLQDAPIRWIVDDVRKFLMREIKRGNRYDAIILDPPTFGRGKTGEVFKIERDLVPLLKQCKTLLSKEPLFFLLTCHTPEYSPLVLKQLLEENFKEKIECGEMLLEGDTSQIPSGGYARWER